ncbi:DUF192 domain-containing protein [Gelidibacter salicanalis]|uniref:DUF192 domain-containing protein n=1 Tax=Gelidibacter salicanalis TaxID=291193 RepID=A0A934KTU9_9FLAO|nr:DUF192 domain-containing protein [Gelidibacter salicanalis]MBJ7881261.1 DUF192 domain-containing protein [Gelidibacter salicanalis]
MTLRAFKTVAMLTLGACCVQFQSCKEEQKTIEPVVIEFKKEGELVLKKANDSIVKHLDIEIADDDYQTQTGLMYRDQMDQNHGMLFVFPEADYHSFYMKNTKIALDIIYIDADKNIVSFQKNAQPFSEASLPSNVPAKYVLEINAGLADEWQLEIGDKIEYQRVN